MREALLTGWLCWMAGHSVLASPEDVISQVVEERSLAQCDLGLYYSAGSADLRRLAGKVAVAVGARPLLTITSDISANRSRRIYSGNVNQFTGVTPPSDYWCFAWIILAESAEQAAIAMKTTLIRTVRKYWTPGSYHKHVVYINDNRPAVRQDIQFGSYFSTIYQANSVFITKLNPDSKIASLYAFDPKALAPGNPAGLPMFKEKKIRIAYMDKVMSMESELIPAYVNNLHDHKLTFATLNWSSSSLVVKTDEGYMWQESFSKWFMDALAQHLNFRYSLMIPDDRVWGAQLKDGSWSGVSGTMLGQADISGLGITREREMDMDFAYSYISESFTFCMSRPKPLPQWLSIIRPFDGIETWGAVMGAILVVSVTFFLLKVKLFQSDGRRSSDNLLGDYGDSFFLSYRLLLSSVDSFEFNSSAYKGFFILCSLIFFMIASFYKSSLISHLTSPAYGYPLNSLEELVRSDTTWGIVDNKAIEYIIFSTSNVQIYKEMFTEMKFCPNYLECLTEAARSNFAFISLANFQSGFISEFFTDTNGQKLLVQAKNYFNGPISLALALPSGSPLQTLFSTLVLRIQQAGIIDRWTKDVEANEMNRGQAYARMQVASGGPLADLYKGNLFGKEQALSLYHLQTAFYLLFGGLILSTMVFLSEVCITRMKSYYKPKSKQMY